MNTTFVSLLASCGSNRSTNRVPDRSRVTGYDGAGWSRLKSAARNPGQARASGKPGGFRSIRSTTLAAAAATPRPRKA